MVSEPQVSLIFLETNDANQHFYELKQSQKNNWIQKMNNVNQSLNKHTSFKIMIRKIITGSKQMNSVNRSFKQAYKFKNNDNDATVFDPV